LRIAELVNLASISPAMIPSLGIGKDIITGFVDKVLYDYQLFGAEVLSSC
jgi:hypothetical protein